MISENGKKVKVIDDEDQPSEELFDKKTGKRKARKKKIINEDGEVEEVKEIIEDIQSEYDEETGKKLPKKRRYKNKDGNIFVFEEPAEEKDIETEDKKRKKIINKYKEPTEVEEDEKPEIITTKIKKSMKKIVKKPKGRKEIAPEEEEQSEEKVKTKKKIKQPKNAITKDGKQVQIIDDEDQPSEELFDKKTGKRIPRKKKIINSDGEVEDVEEIIESDVQRKKNIKIKKEK